MKNQKQKIKLFVVRKYVWAHDASGAIRKEREQKPDDVYVDEEWKKQPPQVGSVGFYAKPTK